MTHRVSTGLDFKDSDALQIPMMEADPSRKAFALIQHLRHLQASFNGIEMVCGPSFFMGSMFLRTMILSINKLISYCEDGPSSTVQGIA